MTWALDNPHEIEVHQRRDTSRGVDPVRYTFHLWEDPRERAILVDYYRACECGSCPGAATLQASRVRLEDLKGTLRMCGASPGVVRTALRKVEQAVYARGAALLAQRKGA